MIENILKHSVRLNGLLIPGRSIEGILSKYAHPLVIWNHNETYPCGLIGSSTGIYYQNRYLLLCTRHQLKVLDGRSYEDVGLLDKDGGSFCSGAGIRHYQEGVNEFELHDLTVFDFTKPCSERTQMKERFFNINGPPPNIPSDQIIALIVYGYPSEKQKYDLNEETKHLGFKKESAVCLLAPHNDQSKEDPTTLKIDALEALKFDPDGMSGGAAFVIQLFGTNAQAYLAGIVLRAGRDSFHILRIGHILNSIDSWLTQPARLA